MSSAAATSTPAVSSPSSACASSRRWTVSTLLVNTSIATPTDRPSARTSAVMPSSAPLAGIRLPKHRIRNALSAGSAGINQA